MDWVRFFFGTPARLFVWLILTGLVVVSIAPGFLAMAFASLLSEVLQKSYIRFSFLRASIWGTG